MAEKYNIDKLENAYRKLKSYIYYDNFFVYLREKIAAFEADYTEFETRLTGLLAFLNNPQGNKLYYQNLLAEIDTIVIAKKYKNLNEDEDFVISNTFISDKYEIDKVNYLINAPVEIHIISILWILEDGYLLTRDYVKNNYAYCLETDVTNKVVDGLRLFKPYFEQYQKWRDNAIEKAQHFLKEETDVLIIGIDIKEYFYNISFDNRTKKKLFEKIIERKPEDDKDIFLTKLLFGINNAYSLKLPDEKKNSSIPIGLLSSGVLSNWFLKDLDNQIIDNLSPAYYGRYVDDIVIVLANAKIPDKNPADLNPLSSIDRTFLKFFIERKILQRDEEEMQRNRQLIKSDPCKKEDIVYRWTKNRLIKIQKSKISLHSFNSKESKAVLEKFKKNIRKNSSAFWLLPNENQINDDFDESVYDLSYTDTINKLRSISEVKLSKYGASIFLAKKIKVSLLSENQIDEQTTDQILTFFKGRMNLEFISIWEKVLTYFLITNDHSSFCLFIRETIDCIDKIKFEDNSKEEEIKRSQLKFLLNSMSLALSLNSNFVLNDYTKERIKGIRLKWYDRDIYSEVVLMTHNYKKTNLFRHSYVVQPLMNFIRGNIFKTDFTKYNLGNYRKVKLDEFKLKYSPRYVYFFEFTHFFSLSKIVNLSDKITKIENGLEAKVDSLFLRKEGEIAKNDILDIAFDRFFETNYLLRNPQKFSPNPSDENSKEIQLAKLKKRYFRNVNQHLRSESIIYDFLEVSDKQFKESIRVAVANIKVEDINIKASFVNKANTSKERRKEFINILNEAEKNKADFLILPELSVPHQWLPILADESRRKDRAIISGLEHVTLDNICYNFSVTILPFDNGGIKDCVVVLRLKNHYAPHEELLIKNKGKIVPKPRPYTYNKFIWNKVHFSVYNCYELADITHRTIFKSEVDLLFASEYNKDTNYFSNIVDTITRDVHCYFIQSNSSDYGDSRITKPSRTETKDVLRLKGGTNNVILCGDIDLKQLREFQSTRISGQNGILFKKTPPDYDHNKAEDRLKGK